MEKQPRFNKLDPSASGFLKNCTRIILNTLIIITAVQILGVPAATIVTALGSCGIAIGLALQGGLSNIAGGVIIMFFHPFRVNDYISTPMGDGKVTDIGIFYTTLKTSDNTDITIPNSTLADSTVQNVTAHSTRRMDIDLSISYESDISLARRVILASVEGCEGVLTDPAPQVFVSEQADSAIILKLRLWVESDRYWDVRFRLLEDTKNVLDKFEISIPYPQLDVHIKNS